MLAEQKNLVIVEAERKQQRRKWEVGYKLIYKMTNNDILKKLRVALKLRDDDVIKILKLANFNMTKSELNALYQKEDHPNYKECGDQVLRNFLNGLIIHMRGPSNKEREPEE